MSKLPITEFSKSGFLLGAGLALAAAAVKIVFLDEMEAKALATQEGTKTHETFAVAGDAAAARR